MRRILFYVCLTITFNKIVSAQPVTPSSEQIYQLELQLIEEALLWARTNNFPAHITQENGSAMGIVRIEDQLPVYFTTHNKRAGARTQTGLLHRGLDVGINLTGAGLNIGLWDEGAALNTHQEFDARIHVVDKANVSNHSTHVAGTLIARGFLDEATGMAPDANILSYNWNFHTSEMQSEAKNGLLISNHSYGRVAGWHQLGIEPGHTEWYWFGNPSASESEDYSFGSYDRDAALFDMITHTLPYYLPVVSAGNERDDKGPVAGTYKALDKDGRWITYDASLRPIQPDGGEDGFDTLTSFAVAKNVLTIGSSWIDENTDLLNLSVYSSAGPTDDGRIKPDLMGMGENLFSSTGSSFEDYAVYSGTSMATPNVAGSLLLLQQLAQQVRNQPLRSATLKGLAIHTATDLGRRGPDFSYGWGLLNTTEAAKLIMAAFREPGIIQENTLENGLIQEEALVHYQAGPLKITLSWTDPPASTNNVVTPEQLNDRSPRLINDLDILLIHNASGQTYHPYILSTRYPAEPAGNGNNVVDPLEQIYVRDAPTGAYTLQISHKGALAGAGQPFSLLVSGINTSQSPIVLESADAQAEVGKLTLVWKTRLENLPGDFIIEKAGPASSIAAGPLSVNYQPITHLTSEGSSQNGGSYIIEDQVYLKGVYQYRIIFEDAESHNRMLVTELTVDVPAPTEFSIQSIFPNPATTDVKVVIDIPGDMEMEHRVFNLLGRQVYNSESRLYSAGRHFIPLDTSSWAPGIYFVQVQSNNKQLVQRVVVL